jgi:hypothetical protein
VSTCGVSPEDAWGAPPIIPPRPIIPGMFIVPASPARGPCGCAAKWTARAKPDLMSFARSKVTRQESSRFRPFAWEREISCRSRPKS